MKLKANNPNQQFAMDTHNFESYLDSNLNYHRCISCGYIVYQVNCETNTYYASANYQMEHLSYITCNESIMQSVME